MKKMRGAEGPSLHPSVLRQDGAEVQRSNGDVGEAEHEQLAGRMESPVHGDDAINRKVAANLKIHWTV